MATPKTSVIDDNSESTWKDISAPLLVAISVLGVGAVVQLLIILFINLLQLSVSTTLFFSLIFQLAMFGAYLWYSKYFSVTQQPMLNNEGNEFGLSWSIISWLSIFAPITVFGIVIRWLLSPLSGADGTSSAYDSLASNTLEIGLLTLSAVVIAPVVEELVYRKLVMDRLERVVSTKVNLFISALAFSMIHWLQDIRGSTWDFTIGHALSTFFLGLLLGYIYLRTRNIIYPIIVHAINNGISFSITIVDILSPSSNVGAFSLVVVLGLSAIVAIIRIIKHRHSIIRYSKIGLSTAYKVATTREYLISLGLVFLWVVLLPVAVSILLSAFSLGSGTAMLFSLILYLAMIAFSFRIIRQVEH